MPPRAASDPTCNVARRCGAPPRPCCNPGANDSIAPPPRAASGRVCSGDRRPSAPPHPCCHRPRGKRLDSATTPSCRGPSWHAAGLGAQARHRACATSRLGASDAPNTLALGEDPRATKGVAPYCRRFRATELFQIRVDGHPLSTPLAERISQGNPERPSLQGYPTLPNPPHELRANEWGSVFDSAQTPLAPKNPCASCLNN